MKNLVIAMAGDGSLHEKYAFDRQFELWVCYWGDDESVARRYEQSCDRLFRIKGQKWALVREISRVAREQGLPPFTDYGYVFLPDDDIEFTGGPADISRTFALASEVKADIFQPAIANEHYSWDATRRDDGAVCRATTTVEIMMPGYSGEIFEQCVLPLLHILAWVRAGWGLEPLIARFAGTVLKRAVRTFVLDALPAIHTRPVGEGSSAYELGMDEAFLNPFVTAVEMRELGRFETAGDAARFVFPANDDSIDWSNVEKHFKRVRGARELHILARQKNLSGYILNGLQKLAGRGIKM